MCREGAWGSGFTPIHAHGAGVLQYYITQNCCKNVFRRWVGTAVFEKAKLFRHSHCCDAQNVQSTVECTRLWPVIAYICMYVACMNVHTYVRTQYVHDTWVCGVKLCVWVVMFLYGCLHWGLRSSLSSTVMQYICTYVLLNRICTCSHVSNTGMDKKS